MSAGDIRDTLGDNIRRLRRERNLTQEALGFAAGFDQAYLSGLERGLGNPTVAVLKRLARALDIPPDRLFRSEH